MKYVSSSHDTSLRTMCSRNGGSRINPCCCFLLLSCSSFSTLTNQHRPRKRRRLNLLPLGLWGCFQNKPVSLQCRSWSCVAVIGLLLGKIRETEFAASPSKRGCKNPFCLQKKSSRLITKGLFELWKLVLSYVQTEATTPNIAWPISCRLVWLFTVIMVTWPISCRLVWLFTVIMVT